MSRRMAGWKEATRVLFGTTQVRRILGVALGAASAQVALLLASPVLTRLFTPEDFGVYSYFFATLGFLSPVATLRYELAIPLPSEERDAGNVALAGVGASLGIGIVSAAALAMGLMLDIGPVEAASAAFLVGLPLGIATAGIYHVLTYWAVRHDHFRSIAVGRGTLGGATSVAQIAFGLPALGSFGLILGDLAGRGAAALAMLRDLRSTMGRRISSIDPRAVLEQARRFRGFALLSCPSALMNSLALFLPLLAVGWIYGAEAAGWLFLAQRVVGLPATLLTSATAQVYIAEFTKIEEEERPALYRRTLGRLAALSVLPFLVGALAAPLVFPVLFGTEWAAAGTLGMLLAPYYFFQLLSGSTISTLDTLELHGGRMVREAGLLTLTAAVFAVPLIVSTETELSTLIGVYSAAGSAFYLASIVFVRFLMARPAGR